MGPSEKCRQNNELELNLKTKNPESVAAFGCLWGLVHPRKSSDLKSPLVPILSARCGASTTAELVHNSFAYCTHFSLQYISGEGLPGLAVMF